MAIGLGVRTVYATPPAGDPSSRLSVRPTGTGRASTRLNCPATGRVKRRKLRTRSAANSRWTCCRKRCSRSTWSAHHMCPNTPNLKSRSWSSQCWRSGRSRYAGSFQRGLKTRSRPNSHLAWSTGYNAAITAPTHSPHLCGALLWSSHMPLRGYRGLSSSVTL